MLSKQTIICKWLFRHVQRWLCHWLAPMKACFLHLPLSTKNLQMNARGNMELCLDHTGSQLNLEAVWVFFLLFFLLFKCLFFIRENMSKIRYNFPKNKNLWDLLSEICPSRESNKCWRDQPATLFSPMECKIHGAEAGQSINFFFTSPIVCNAKIKALSIK